MDATLKFRALLGLAYADGLFEDAEKKFIRSLAEKEGLKVSQLKDMLKTDAIAKKQISELEFDDKVDILSNLVMLMKVDGKVHLSEIRYCESIAEKFGFTEKVIGFLSGSIEGADQNESMLGRIKFRMRKYLKEVA